MNDIKIKGVSNTTTLEELLTLINEQRKTKNNKKAIRLQLETLFGHVNFWGKDTIAQQAVLAVAPSSARDNLLSNKVAVLNNQIEKANVGSLCVLNAAVKIDEEETRYYW